MKIIFQNRLKLREEQQALIDELRMRDAEDVHATKIKLETDVQVLEQQLESMRASYQLNQEKLVSQPNYYMQHLYAISQTIFRNTILKS